MTGIDRFERARAAMQDVTENPEMVNATIGTLVFDMMKAGEALSKEAILRELEAVARGESRRANLTAPLAKGAVKVISDLPGP